MSTFLAGEGGGGGGNTTNPQQGKPGTKFGELMVFVVAAVMIKSTSDPSENREE